jgi:tetratricopeptide (TPR) repeat protein
MKGALDLYDRALSLDPDSATALGGVALCRCLVADYMYECPKPLLQAARIAADKALVIEPGCTDALLALTKVRLDYDWNFDSALATIQKAVPLAPNNRIALFLNAWVLVLMGRFADAHSFLGTCTHDFPGAELVRVCRGVALLYERNFADAIAELSTACARWPHFWFGHLSLGQALFLSGEVQRAIQKFDWIRLSEFDPLIDGQVNVRFLAEGYAMYARFRSNDASGAEASLDRLRRLSQRQFIPATCFALAELGRRQYAKALSYIRQSGENRESWYTHLGIEPFVDDVRSDAKRYAV